MIAARLISCYPNGGANAGDGYIAALAAILVTFTREDANDAADPIRGVPANTKFLPTPADILEWHEKRQTKRAPQYSAADKITAAIAQTLIRRKEDEYWAICRDGRPTLTEMREHYGANWGLHPRDPARRKWQPYSITELQAMGGLTDEQWAALPDVDKPLREIEDERNGPNEWEKFKAGTKNAGKIPE